MPVSAGTGRAAGYPLRSPEYRRVAIALFLAGVATFAMLSLRNAIAAARG